MGSTAKSGVSPTIVREHTTAAATDRTTGTTVRKRKLPVTSSKTNSAPPIGALNATASPAPDTEVCSRRSCSGRRAQRAVSAPTAAPMCTIGPSRPRTRPDPIDRSAPTNLEGSTDRGGGSACPRSTASTCWIPLPEARGTIRTISAASRAPRIVIPTGTSHPGPGSSCAHSAVWIRHRSSRSRHQRKAPPTTPMTAPATIASTQIVASSRAGTVGSRTFSMSTRRPPTCRRRADPPGGAGDGRAKES